MRHSILFLGLCAALDEIVTFSILSKGGVELNPKTAWLISINPLLYPLADATLIFISLMMNKLLIERKLDLWFIWTAAGMVRLFCAIISLFGIGIINPYSISAII